ncbi:hypothetical protein ACLK1T_26520 [Escherichia coli]
MPGSGVGPVNLDKDAEWARAGKVLPLLQNLLSDPISRNLHRKAPDAIL